MPAASRRRDLARGATMLTWRGPSATACCSTRRRSTSMGHSVWEPGDLPC